MIKELYVELSKDTEERNFILDLDRDPRIRYLYLGHPTDSKIVYSINIYGGWLIIGLNKLKRINSLELSIYRKNWKPLSDILSRPQPTMNGSVEFVNVNSRLNEFDDLILAVHTDKKQSSLKIEIGECDRSNSFWVAISDNCLAEIVDHYLVGFWIDMSD